MRQNESEILEAIRGHISVSDLKKQFPSLTKKSLDKFFELLIQKISKNESAEIYIDGASDSKGIGGIGVIMTSNGSIEERISRSVGKATNNEAEYLALITGLELALKHNFNKISIYSDSELLVKQVKGIYRVKANNLKPLHDRVVNSLDSFGKYSLKWIPREKNSVADTLAKNGSKS